MNYQNFNNQLNDISFERSHFLGIVSLYLFSFGSGILGYSIYLIFQAIGIIEKSSITWNAQGIFWGLIIFCVSLFLLFLPVEFINLYKLFISSFRDLIINIFYVIFISLIFLIIFQFILSDSNLILKDIIEIGKAVSFSGFIAVPLILFLQHNLLRSIELTEKLTYLLTLFFWIFTTQIFL